VLDKGKILEQGTHSQLLQSRGMYHDLWRAQYLPAGLPSEAAQFSLGVA